jgi:hypothetical protein
MSKTQTSLGKQEKAPSMFESAAPKMFAARSLRMALVALVAVLLPGPRAHAQRGSVDLGMTYQQERSKFVGSADADYFYLRGAAVDLGYTVWKGIGVTGSATGLAGTNLQSNIDIHHVEMLGGVRYTYNLGHITPMAWNRKGGIFLEGKGGYTFATSGLYPVNGVIATSASALTYAGGGGINFHIYHRFDLRLIEAHYVISKLPNGGTNQQNTLRFGSGLNFHFGN